MAGLYQVIEKVGHLFHLNLLAAMKIHPVISPDKLRKAATDALPGQYNGPPESIIINDEEEWEAEEILTSGISRGPLQYKVKSTLPGPQLRISKGSPQLHGNHLPVPRSDSTKKP